jgi:alcohol dehydrogenase
MPGVSATWWLRQARAMGDPGGLVASRFLLERQAALRRRRLRGAAIDAARERLRPSRPRMRTLVLLPGGRLAWRRPPAPPPPGPLGAVVRPLAVATCDLDRPIALGATPFPAPMAFGHECVAEVLTVGGDVATVRPGDRVVVPFQISCGTCAACRAGRTGNCLSVPPASMYGFGVSGGHWGGAIADELAVPFADGMLVPLPDGLDPVAAASVADNVSDAHRHIAPYLPALLARDPDARVLIVGAMSPRHLFTASVALYAGLVARALGARDVVLADAREGVREQAAGLGLTAVTAADARRTGLAPLVVDLSASPAGLHLALSLTAPDGVCTCAGTLHATARIPALLMYGRNVTLTIARSHARAVIPEVLELMARGRLRPELVTTLVAPMDEAREALAAHLRGESTKTILSAVG